MLTVANKELRKFHCKKLLRRFTVARAHMLFFSGEKVFILKIVTNRQNDRIIEMILANTNSENRMTETIHP